MKIFNRITVIFVVIVVLFANFSVFAKEKSIVIAKYKTVGNELILDVNINENSDLLGFKITINYPDALQPKSVYTGELTKNGFLEDSILTSSGKSFFVVWSGVNEIKNKGCLFSVAFDIKADEHKELEFGFSYSKEDTFDKNYEDVELEFKQANKEESETVKTTIDIKDDDLLEKIDVDLIVSIDGNLNNKTVENLSSQQKQEIVEKFKNEIEQKQNASIITSKNKEAAFEEVASIIKSAQKNKFINDLNNNVDRSYKEEIINQILKDFGVSSLKDLTLEQKQEFLNKFFDRIKADNKDVFSPSYYDVEELVEAINTDENTSIKIVVIVLLSLIITGVILLFFIKKRCVK